MNIRFEHKEIHTYTREVRKRNERSIMDYLRVNRGTARKIKDVIILQL